MFRKNVKEIKFVQKYDLKLHTYLRQFTANLFIYCYVVLNHDILAKLHK